MVICYSYMSLPEGICWHFGLGRMNKGLSGRSMFGKDHIWLRWFDNDNLLWLRWFGTWLLFSIINIWDVILPIDELIFFKMVIAPPTRYVLQQFIEL